MAVRALNDEYNFPSRSRQELYGDDLLVHVMWRGNMMFCAAACFRVPKAMPWSEFLANMVDPWASSDPGYVPRLGRGWVLDDKQFDPQDGQTLSELGVGHKSLIEFEA